MVACVNGVLRSLASPGSATASTVRWASLFQKMAAPWWNLNAAGATAAYWCSSRAHLEHPPSPAGGRRTFLVSGLAASKRRPVCRARAEWAILAAAPTPLAVGSSREPEHTR